MVGRRSDDNVIFFLSYFFGKRERDANRSKAIFYEWRMIPWKISTEKIPSHIKDFFDLASLEYSIRLCFTLKRERELH
jgi:hypothetical protein